MLFFVIFVSAPFAWQILAPADFVEYAESIISSLFFSSNFYFYFATTEYGADSALLKPFLHTWSLSVEEQFYLVFPILAIVALKYFRTQFFSVLIAVSFLSLQFAEVMSVKNSDLNFYLPFSRFWELAVGAALAYTELNIKVTRDGVLHRVLPTTGLYLVAYSISTFDGKTPHPSFQTIVPILGIALIIGFASADEVVGKVLGSKPFVWVGLVSYSAYLWHFPIFALFRYQADELDNYTKFALILITFCLSIFSYFAIETPFRKRIGIKKFLWCSILSFLAIVAFCLFSMKFFDYKNVEESSRVTYKSILDRRAFLEVWRDKAMREISDTNFSDNDNKKVLIVGNSHAIDFFRVLNSANLYDKIDFGMIAQNRNTDNYQVSCLYTFLRNGDTACGKKGIKFDDVVPKIEKAELIILKTRWSNADFKILQHLVTLLKNTHGKNVLIIGNAFEQRSGPIPIRQFVKENRALPNAKQVEVLKTEVFETAPLKRINAVDNQLLKIASQTKVPFLPFKDLFCNFQIKSCDIYTDDGYLLLWDYGHLTIHGSEYLGSVINKRRWGEKYISVPKM